MENIQKNFQSLINHMEEQREQFKTTTHFFNRSLSELLSSKNLTTEQMELLDLIMDHSQNLFYYMEDFSFQNLRDGMEKDSELFKKELSKNLPSIFTPKDITDYLEKHHIKI